MFKRARSSVTGRFVSLWYAIRHPNTTTVESVKPNADAAANSEHLDGGEEPSDE